jgi:hypothetical protein
MRLRIGAAFEKNLRKYEGIVFTTKHIMFVNLEIQLATKIIRHKIILLKSCILFSIPAEFSAGYPHFYVSFLRCKNGLSSFLMLT